MPNTTVNMLDTVISSELSKYSQEIANVLKMNTTQIAEECSDEIKSRSPENTGKYKKGWKAVKSFENDNAIRYKVKNAKSPQLTHLLEFGHAKVNGGRVEGKEHILISRDHATEKYINMMKEGIENGIK